MTNTGSPLYISWCHFPWRSIHSFDVCSRQGLLHGAGEQCGYRCHGLRGDIFLTSPPLGYGGLGLSIEGPSKVDINCEDMEDGTCKVTYCPTEPGTYIINIKFADKHVPGKALGLGLGGDKSGDQAGDL